jgi:hypothetical protein
MAYASGSFIAVNSRLTCSLSSPDGKDNVALGLLAGVEVCGVALYK